MTKARWKLCILPLLSARSRCLLWSSLLRNLTLALCTSTHLKSISLELYTMPAVKRKSDAMDVTPTGSPTKKMRLTQHQKQALMDNLQLESGLNCGFTE